MSKLVIVSQKKNELVDNPNDVQSIRQRASRAPPLEYLMRPTVFERKCYLKDFKC